MSNHPHRMKETEALQRDLEWVTDPTARPERGVDPQTVALREAWMAWGRLLENAEAPVESSLIQRPKPRPPARRWLRAGMGIAAALLTLVAGSVWLALAARRADSPISEPEVVARTPGLPHPAETNTPPQDDSELKGGPSPVTSNDPAIAWDDTVDDEIAKVGENLIEVQQDWHTRTDALDVVWCGLGQIQAEVETEQL